MKYASMQWAILFEQELNNPFTWSFTFLIDNGSLSRLKERELNMIRMVIGLLALLLASACSITDSARSVSNVRYIAVPDMKTGIVPGGATRIPENANAGQKLYLNPVNDAMMLCALVDEVTDTCLRFYRH